MDKMDRRFACPGLDPSHVKWDGMATANSFDTTASTSVRRGRRDVGPDLQRDL